MSFEFSRPLIFVAHPDDETIACAGLMQRMAASLVVFATDGAPPHYGFERKFGSLENYSRARFHEAAQALGQVSNCSLHRLVRAEGSYFVDQHLFQDIPQALASLCKIARDFSPDALITHAYEGGHIDHDTCSFIARHAADALSLRRFEFPLYWMDGSGKATKQTFRDVGDSPTEWRLTEAEVLTKGKMLAEYRTQAGLAAAFPPATERIRPASRSDFSIAPCPSYSYRSWWSRFWHSRISARSVLKKFAQFELQTDRTKTSHR